MAPNNTTHHGAPYPPRHSSMENQRDAARHGTTAAEEGVSEGSRGSGYSHGVVASHFLAQQPPSGREGETWMDFLVDQNVGRQARNNTSTPPMPHSASSLHVSPHSSLYNLPNRPSRTDSSSSINSDRKRRLTTAESPMRRPSSIRMHSSVPGASNSDPIVLDSSPASTRQLPPLPPPQPNDSHNARRGSDIVLPPWQPDADVSQCPVCGRSFTFLYRKHHCRKCGRVVCATCSPHRITIPRQFIVHPPSDGSPTIIDLTGDEDSELSTFGPFRNPALGGGEEVRVCNPCVPDPNYGPPPQYTPAIPARYSSHAPSSTRPYTLAGPPPHPRAQRSVSSVYDPSPSVGPGQTQRAHHLSTDSRRVSFQGGLPSAERQLPPLPIAGHMQAQTMRPPDHNTSTSRYTVPNNGQLPFNLGPGSQSVVNMFPRSPFTAVPASNIPTQQPPRPRRQIAEEDECPICGNELPPKGPSGDEADRTQHIEECIALHSASPAAAPLTQTTSASLPTQRSRGMSNAGEGASNASRMSHAARGMFPFTATEKDCIDADGNEEECIICFEEYEAGDKMARLVCWCKFHEKCIKEWWSKKGRGACPTHQLHE
ncbi:FYVE-domain-containing protein [Ophiobolus disseminans]|uniref:RING-type E3 ubiquitin transferase n=1 Tax=Ophiobolus disseminans TaxID=1469910 RepID=A0A6A6ZP40_9PLEO|nr:FYVE-domain-containing protein [Ophiobolus disseminans]